MNITRQEAIKLLLGTAALAVVPSTIKAIDLSPKPPTPDLVGKIDRAVRHFEALYGRRYDPSNDSLSVKVPNGHLYMEEALAYLQKVYKNSSLHTSKSMRKDRMLVQIWQRPYVEYWITYDFDTHTWHDSTGSKPFVFV